MKLVKVEPIAVRDKNDVVRALTILERVGIKIMSEDDKRGYILDESKKVNNNFLIQEDDGGFRVQSHYIGYGISLDNLERQVNDIVEEYPDICLKLLDLQKREIEFKKMESELKGEMKECFNITEK